MHADPVTDAARQFDARYLHAEEQAHAEAIAATCFVDACRNGDANSAALFAKRIPDTYRIDGPTSIRQIKTTRYQTLAEVLSEAMDYTGGPDMTEAWQLILNAANGSISHGELVIQANNLLERAATAWAANNVTLEAD